MTILHCPYKQREINHIKRGDQLLVAPFAICTAINKERFFVG